MKKYYMIGNTHFDPVWLWRWDEAMASIRATFRSALDRMREDADFTYSFCTPPVFEWIRNTDPALFEEICERVREGRWELAEGWWVQPDCYGASGESYIRQGLYGQRYLLHTFGKTADTVFNIDSFGHSPALPQILAGSGIRNYCFVRPERKHISLPSAYFVWESPDGSSVRAYRTEAAYEKNWRDSLALHKTEEDALIVFGVTDHGGAPTKRAIAEIRADGNAEFSTVGRYFKEHEPTVRYVGELLTGDFGPYANYARIKQRNRVAEYALLFSERAAILDGRDERGALRAAWQDVLFNQFHDILGGASIKDAYIDAENMLGRATATANEIMHYSLQSLTRRIHTPGTNADTAWNLVLWNLHGALYSGYVEAEVQWVHEFDWYDGGIALEDANGVRIPCQVIREKSVIPRFRSRFIFKVDVPSVGYRALRVVQTGERVEKKLLADPYHVTTARLDVTFDRDGTISCIKDRESGRKLGGRMLRPEVFSDEGDTWAFNIDAYGASLGGCSFEGFSVIEHGEILTEIKGTYRRDEALLEIYYRFYRDTPYFDVRYRVRWEGKHACLKLCFDVNAHHHLAAVPAGEIGRGESRADLPLGAWVRTEDFTVVSGGAYAYSMADGTLGVTLLRSPIYGDLRLGEIDDALDYDVIDRGITEGCLRILFEGDAWQASDELNAPPVIIDESNHEGDLPSEHSFLSLLGEGVQLMALKAAEDGDGVIVRVRETCGRTADVTVNYRDRAHSVTLKPYEIRTLRLTKHGTVTINMIEFEEF